jgi:hypothetical protein
VSNVIVLDKSSESSAERHPRFDRANGLDPSLVIAARKMYRTFYEVHPEVAELPLGIAIDRYSYRGKLIFARMPALLPQETFLELAVIDQG